MTATYPPPDFSPSVPGPDDVPGVARIESSVLPASVRPGPELPAPPASPAPEPGRFRRAANRLPRWAGPLAVGALALTACTYVGLVDPNQPNASPFFPVCTFKQVTGFDCPGCGLTRAMHALVTGHPLTAIDHNIFILAIFPLAAYMYTRWLLKSTVGYELPAVRSGKLVAYGLLPLVLTFWVVRNLPFGPFHYLAATAG